MQISDFLTVLEDLKNEEGNLEVMFQIKDKAADLDSEHIVVLNSEDNEENILALDISSFVEKES